jgi:uncharacterized protein (DUF302 family)
VTKPRDAVVTKLSPWSVTETVARLKAIAHARGLKVFAVIDLGAEAEALGVELRETQVIMFGSPASEAALIASHPVAALDIPMKVVVWGDGCETRLSYTALPGLAARYRLAPELTNRLPDIDAVTDAAIDR